MKKEEMDKVSGGWGIAANGFYILTDKDESELQKKGFKVGDSFMGSGEEEVEFAFEINNDQAYVCAVSYNGERATPEQLANVLGTATIDYRVDLTKLKSQK